MWVHFIIQYWHAAVNFFGLKFSNLWVQYWMNTFLVVCSSHGNTIWPFISPNNTVFIVCKNHHLLYFRLWATKFFWSKQSFWLPNITLGFYFRFEIPYLCLIDRIIQLKNFWLLVWTTLNVFARSWYIFFCVYQCMRTHTQSLFS